MKIENCKGYELLQEELLPDLDARGYLLRHKKTGAHVALVENADPNKVFCIGFRTPSRDSTGVAHIVEHSVLCGSREFPAKDPFVELIKSSLNTFLNAMTFPDKTIYPIASCNEKDFANLMHVYLDAVFYPNIYIHKEIFQQEGWHYELENKEDPITLNGVVYNEMKGAFSAPESVLERQILNSLYPDTSYQYESGGDPKVIPELTYEGFLDFHSRYYHPSNSYIYLYGDLNMEEKLNWMDDHYLSQFEALAIDSEIKKQAPFEKKVEVVLDYPISDEEEEEDNTYLSYNVSVDTSLNKELYVAMGILEYVLISAPGAPLKQALLDAGIAKDVIGTTEASIYQPIFSIMAKNSNLEKKDEFLSIIQSTLRKQVEEGLNKRSLLASLNGFEFRWREADFGNYPKGLLLGIQCLDSWLYEKRAPFLHLNELQVVSFLKEQLDTDYFEKIIETYLLDNNHCSVVAICPKRGLLAKQEEELARKLAVYKDSLSEAELEQIIEETRNLRIYQSEPSTEEEMEKIPMLEIEDIGKEAEPVVTEEGSILGVPALYHPAKTNGIAYINFLFDASGVTEEQLPYLGLLKAILGYVDTQNFGYRDLSEEINLYTGGIGNSVNYLSHLKTEELITSFEISARTLMEQLPKTLELVEEILFHSQLKDEKRFYEILAELKSRMQMSFSTAGNTVASGRAMSYFSEREAYADRVQGVSFYRSMDALLNEFEDKKRDAIAILESLIQELFRKENLTISFGGEREDYEIFAKAAEGFLNRMPAGDLGETKKAPVKLELIPKREGLLSASQVLYVCRAGNFKKKGFSYTGALRVLRMILGYEYLWQNIRVKGGAYGCMNGFGRNGDSFFVSYRDPNLGNTISVFEEIPAYLRNFTVSKRDMTKYLIGTIGDVDTPLTPPARVRRALTAYTIGLTTEDLQRERDEILATREETIVALADLVEAILENDALCVVGKEEKIRQEKERFTELSNLN